MTTRVVLVFSVLLWGGCAARLPTYPAMSDEDALAVIADRLESVRSVSGAAAITLRGADGRSVRLDGALAARPGRSLRLRAWKFNTAVFDLTVEGDEAWLMQSERAAARGAGEVPARGIIEAMEMMGEPFFRSARAVTDIHSGVLRAIGAGEEPAVWEIDRATLTPRRLRVGGASLALDRYRVVDGIVWPMRWRLRGPDGVVDIRLSGVELNRELPASAFVPPRRAVRLGR